MGCTYTIGRGVTRRDRVNDHVRSVSVCGCEWSRGLQTAPWSCKLHAACPTTRGGPTSKAGPR
jgi:hypothetical protein